MLCALLCPDYIFLSSLSFRLQRAFEDFQNLFESHIVNCQGLIPWEKLFYIKGLKGLKLLLIVISAV